MWYRTGTVTLTNGSPNVTGAGTSWLGVINQGDAFLASNGQLLEVQNVNGDGAIVLASNFTGTTGAGQSYAIFPTQGLVRLLTQQVIALISQYSGIATGAGAGKFANGTPAAPGISFVADPDCGLERAGENVISLVAGGVRRLVIAGDGSVVLGVRPNVPALGENLQMVFSLTSETNLRLTVRGSDGIVRSANWPLT